MLRAPARPSRHLPRVLPLLALLLALAVVPHSAVHAGTVLTVTSTLDSDTPPPCPAPGAPGYTLRCALAQAGSDGSGDTIAFDIPPSDPGCSPTAVEGRTVSVCTIEAVAAFGLGGTNQTINGYTQPGSRPNTLPAKHGDNAIVTIRIDGVDEDFYALRGLVLGGAHNTVEGLSVTGFGNLDGVELSGQDNRLVGDFIGELPNGIGWGNGMIVVHCEDAVGRCVSIGGPNASDANVMNVQGHFGIYIPQSSGVTIEGNYIGTDPSGTVAQPTDNSMDLDASSGNLIEDNVIGGAYEEPAAINVDGLGLATTDTIVGNLIGVGTTGQPVANGGDGLMFQDGGGGTVANNVIANNAQSGIFIGNQRADSAVQVSIRHNLIYANGNLGIDLAPQGHVDCDTPPPGPNADTPCPLITAATAARVAGSACPGCGVEVYRADNGPYDQQHGGAVAYLGSTTTSASGSWAVSLSTGQFDPASQQVTATATQNTPGGPATSEFAANVPVRPLVVTTSADTSSCPAGRDRPGYSLRCALQDANAAGHGQLIAFHIRPSDPGCDGDGSCTIHVTSRLPAMSATSTVIDGYTQPGAHANTNGLDAGDNAAIRVRLDGSELSGSGAGITLAGGSNTVRGLSITGFPGDGVAVLGANASSSTIAGDDIGETPTGGEAGNGDNGVDLHAYAGTDQNIVGASTVGGPTPSDRNVIGGNGGNGVAVGGDPVILPLPPLHQPNAIQGNDIGTDPRGLSAVPNRGDGILVRDEHVDEIGGPDRGLGNLIGGNAGNGVEIVGAPTNDDFVPPMGPRGISVQGNLIGTTRDGLSPLPNSGDGVYGHDAYGDYSDPAHIIGNTVGGTEPGAGNTIAYNGGAGVLLGSSATDILTHVAVVGNRIFANGGLGIDLAPQGQVNCDSPPPGPNDYTPCPLITGVTPTQVAGTACTGCTVEVFVANDGPADQGHGSGVRLLGRVQAGSCGRFPPCTGTTAWTLPIGGLRPGSAVTATATQPAVDSYNYALQSLTYAPYETSEFAANVSLPAGGTASVGVSCSTGASPSGGASCGPNPPGCSGSCVLSLKLLASCTPPAAGATTDACRAAGGGGIGTSVLRLGTVTSGAMTLAPDCLTGDCAEGGSISLAGTATYGRTSGVPFALTASDADGAGGEDTLTLTLTLPAGTPTYHWTCTDCVEVSLMT